LTFPVLDALKDGYDVYMVADAVGGTSRPAHDSALRRLEQAGAKPTSWTQMACELQRDWRRNETAAAMSAILFEVEGR
jgi:nicotinamidase-related amidase